MRMRKLVAPLVMALMLPLAAAQDAHAGGAVIHPVSGPAFRAYAKGHHIGPSRYTDYGRRTLRYFRLVKVTPSGRRVWKAVRSRPVDMAARIMVDRPHLSTGPIRTINWWNPTTWDWGGIFGAIWDKITKCVIGAREVLIPTVSTQLAIKLMFKGFALVVGPQGWAGVAIGACFAAVTA